METGKNIQILSLTFLVVIFLLFPRSSHSQPGVLPPAGPLCSSQYVLLNYACSRLPFSPRPPSLNSASVESSPPPDDEEQEDLYYSHQHSGGHHQTPEQQECCRWLREMSVECVCDLLIHLPAFLTRASHDYTVIVDESCAITFACPGRLIIRS